MSEDNADKGFVKAVQNNDITYRFVKVIEEGKGALYVREDLANADFVRTITDQEVAYKYVRPVGLITKLIETEPVVMVPFVGTTGLTGYSTTHLGEKIVELRQYVRPIKEYVPLVMRAITLGRELNAKGIPWVAVVTAYIPGRSKKPKLLILRHARYYVKRYRSRKTGELRAYPELRLFFDRHVFGGMKKGARYNFLLTVLVPKGALRQPRKTFVVPVEPEPKGTETAPVATAQQAQASTVQDIDRQLKELFEALRKVSP